MSILNILQYPNSGLKRQAVPVSDVKEPQIQQIIADMLETLAHTEHCAGLSATQLDMPNPPRITVIAPMPNLEKTLVLVNPEIAYKEGSVVGLEGCMSVYQSDISAEVTRAEVI
ncbi:MAG: peptide deformylase, partial [Gammaproteobacteria bacterium]|nr:peptide deformylase [Gammaproteobacteria bacterium]